MKKNLSKLFALALALIMAMALAVPSFAATITITNGVEGQTYNAYKIFDVTKSSDSYAYSIDSKLYNEKGDMTGDNPWFATVQTFASNPENGMTLDPIVSSTKYNVSFNEKYTGGEGTDTKAAALAQALNNAFLGMDSKPKADGTATATGSNVTEDGVATTITVDEAGYYFVDSSLGALCILNTATDTVNVTEKNEKPSIDKVIVDDNNDHDTTVNIGDTVNYQITVTAGGAADTAYIVHDTMSAGLTLNKNIAITVNDTPVNSDYYTIVYAGDKGVDDKPIIKDGCTFEIKFNVDYTNTLDNGTKILVKYSAVVNENAEVGVDKNTNKAILEYGDSSDTSEDPSVVAIRTFDVVKTTSDGTLLGNEEIGYAKFKLYDAQTSGNEIKLIYDESKGYYRPAVNEGEKKDYVDKLVATDGHLTVYGLAAGKYYLEETDAPKGYNVLESRQEVDLTNTDNTLVENALDDSKWTNEGGIQVINESGAILPGTGGMGTTIFYTLGGLLAVGAAVLLVTKKRVHDAEK